MKDTFKIESIGTVIENEDSFSIKIGGEYLEALIGLEGYSHINIIWWGHLTDSDEYRNTRKLGGLFKKGPGEIGVFATHAPLRPNPILSSTIMVKEIDFKTMQSKRCEHLFFCGEILDVDGVTGGFNFQNAWSSGFVAGKSIEICD